MSLFILMSTGMFAALAHARSMNVRWKIGLRWALAGILGAYAGGRVAEFIPEVVLLTLFAVVVVVASLVMILRRVPPKSHDAEHVPPLKGILAGLVLGFFTGMIGVGGGFLLVPALVLICGLDVKRAIGTSLLIISINSPAFLDSPRMKPFPGSLTVALQRAGACWVSGGKAATVTPAATRLRRVPAGGGHGDGGGERGPPARHALTRHFDV
jgi:hypothetical protein